MEKKLKIIAFLNEPDFNQQFLNYSDSRKWVQTLQINNAIEPTDSQAILSKPTSKEANNYLLTLLVQDPSPIKLRALSEALKENKTHYNQLELAEKIDHFLKSEFEEPQTVSIERKRPRHDAGLQKYDITADSCLQTLECTLMSRPRPPVPSAEDVMKSLYFFTYSLIVALFTEGHLDKIKGQALLIIDRGHMVRVEGKEKSVIMAAESVKKVLDYLGIPDLWDDLLLFVTILLPLKNCDPSCYKEAMGNLDHYKQHLFQYLKVQDMVKNTKALRKPEKTPGQDQVEVHVTVQNSIFQLRYSTCNELLLVVLAEGAGISRDKFEYGPVLPGSSIITFHIPKQYIKSVSKTFYKGAVIWAMLELRVTKIEVLGHFHFDVNWNTAVLPIRDSLLSNGDLFRNTKILPKVFQAIVDLMPPLPGKKALPLQKYQAQLLSDSFSDVLLFSQVDKPKWWDDKKLPVNKSELEMEATELKVKIKSMEDLHHHTMVELHSFKVKLSNERAQVGNLQSQLTKTEKTLLRERNEIERIKELMNQDLLEKVTSLESQLKDSEKAKGEVESLVKKDKLLEKENDELKSRIDHYLKEKCSLERQITSKEKDIEETKNELETAKLSGQDLLEKVTSLELQLKNSKAEVDSLVKEYKLLEKENDKLKSRIDHYSWLEPYLEAVAKHGSVLVNMARCVIIGSSAVGKTCLKYLLVYNQSKEIETSIGVLERPEVVAITSEQFLMEEGSSVWTLVTDSKMEGSIRRIVKDKEYDKKEAYPVISNPGDHGSLAEENEIIEKLVLPPVEVEVPPHLKSSIPTDTPSVTPTKEDTHPPVATPMCSPLDEASKAKASLIKAREEVLENTNLEELKLKEKTFVHLLDTGGQPTFQDSLPFLLTLPATYIQVFNSAKELSQPVELTYRPGSQTCESLPCSESVWDMMQHSLSSIYLTSLRQPELPSEVKLPNLQIFLVATFKDALLAMPNHREALEKIKAQLKGLEDKPYHEHLVCDPENVAFLVNNLMYLNITNESDFKKDQDYLNKLRSLISSKKGCIQLKMPVMWFLLELIMKKIPQILLRYDVLLEFCLDSKYIDRDLADRQFPAMLRLFHFYGFFAYFELKGSPESNWVCTNANILYKEISKLLAIQYHPEFPVAKATRRYKQTGIIRMEDHEDLFVEVGIRPDIPSEWLLEVLHFVNLSAKVQPGVYFLPIVLPYGTTPVPDYPIVENICFAFNFKQKKFAKNLLDLPRGVFCKLAVDLAEKDEWKLNPEESDRSSIHYVHGNLGVYLMEKPGSIEVALFCSEYALTKGSHADHLKQLHVSCKAIKSDLEVGIHKASRKFLGKEFLKRVNLRIGFRCNCGKGIPHLATLSEASDGVSLRCSRPKGLPCKFDTRRKMWCQPTESDTAMLSLKSCSSSKEKYWVLKEKEVPKQSKESLTDSTYPIKVKSGYSMSTKRSATSVGSIIKLKYTHLFKELSLPQLCDHLYERNMIDKALKEKIENATTCVDSNKLYIDYLISNGTISTLKRFAQLLVDTSEELCNEVHREIGRALLDQISTADPSTTSSIQSTLSEQSHLKDVSQSPDTGDVLNERTRSFLCSIPFHDYFHSKCDVRRISTSLLQNGVIGPKDLCKMAPSSPQSAANTELFILLVNEPSISKLKALSESLTIDEEHAPHRELAKRIEKFLRSI